MTGVRWSRSRAVVVTCAGVLLAIAIENRDGSRDVTRLDKAGPIVKPLRWLRRGKRPRRISAKKQAELDAGLYEEACRIVALRSRGVCEIQWTTNVCTVEASDFHHKQMRSAGGPDTPANLLHGCHPCHMTVHANPAAARSRRLLLSAFPGRNE